MLVIEKMQKCLKRLETYLLKEEKKSFTIQIRYSNKAVIKVKNGKGILSLKIEGS